MEGRLPDGIWRLSPLTGVIWGCPSESGSFKVTLEVEDSAGTTTRRELTLEVKEQGAAPSPPPVPWLFEELKTEGQLAIATDSLPPAVAGEEYSAICLAEGGEPFRAEPKRPGSGRYWEFADDTLVAAYQRDKVDLGKDGNVIPRIKTYAEDVGDEVVKNQQTWWPAKDRKGEVFTGFTQDATKHLKKLREIGVVKEIVTTAKPEPLLARLVSIFSRTEDTILEVFGDVADLAAVAIKTGRRVIYLAGESERSFELLTSCVVPRLQGVVDGRDSDLEAIEGEIKVKDDSYLPYEGGGSFVTATLGEWVLAQTGADEFPRLNTEAYAEVDAMVHAIMSAEGFLPVDDELAAGLRPDGAATVVIPPDEYLTAQRAAQVASQLAARFERGVILYFMADEDFDAGLRPEGFVFRRVPTEVAVR